ncbi:MAG: hypothetical protein PHP23_08185, partial [Desulfobacterales bacterium]|nr:hypothetical protein [Desulfobacterales bacterium]
QLFDGFHGRPPGCYKIKISYFLSFASNEVVLKRQRSSFRSQRAIDSRKASQETQKNKPLSVINHKRKIRADPRQKI